MSWARSPTQDSSLFVFVAFIYDTRRCNFLSLNFVHLVTSRANELVKALAPFHI